MRKLLVIIGSLLPFFLSAQTDTTNTTPKDTTLVAPKDTLWKVGGLGNLNFSQIALSNWAGGGESSISVTGLLDVFANYEKGKIHWDNRLNLGYGLLRQGEGGKVVKTDDKIDFSSQLGREIRKNVSYVGYLGFRSQFDKGFNLPNDSVKISDFLAPGYVILSLGLKYKPVKWIKLYASPLTGKITIVNDQTLADEGAFGVDPGEKVRTEFGGLVRVQIEKELMENVSLSTNVEAFSNYSEDPDHIDVNWEALLAMKVNEFLTASITTNLIYDHDVKIGIDENNDGIIDKEGPRVQFKEVLSVGLSYKF